jgi:hypothetical protein
MSRRRLATVHVCVKLRGLVTPEAFARSQVAPQTIGANVQITYRALRPAAAMVRPLVAAPQAVTGKACICAEKVISFLHIEFRPQA